MMSIRSSIFTRSSIRKVTGFALFGVMLASSAMAVPVLTNGGFEQNPPSRNGNNIPTPITPWVLGTGNNPNVVKVDGPGGFNYGSSGPESDASAPGAGVAQHYLDIANGNNDFYQPFTPLCTGEVVYGAYFSSRDNRAGSGSISIIRDDDESVVGAETPVNVPGANSKTDPWERTSATSSVTAGTTYRFLIAMDNNLNVDNAFVVFQTDCDAHEAPDFTTGLPEPEPDPTPDPDPQPDPEPTPDPAPKPDLGACSPFKPELSCNEASGALEVNLTNELHGEFDPSDIEIISHTDGVTVTRPDAANPMLVALEGASAGQTIILETRAVADGAGSKPGIDLCCMGEIEIVIPDDLPCLDGDDSHEGGDPSGGGDDAGNDGSGDGGDVGNGDDPVDPQTPFLELTKTCRKQDGPAQGLVLCDIDISYSGPAPTQDNPLVINDQMNTSATWMAMGFNSTDAWNCPAIPIMDGGAINCELTGVGMPAETDWNNFTSTIQLELDIVDAFENCASGSIVYGEGSLQANDCYSYGGDNAIQPVLSISKEGPDTCAGGEPCIFTYTVSETAGAAFNGAITLDDVMTVTDPSTGNSGVHDNFTSISPALCDVSDLTSGNGCTGQVSIPANGSISYQVAYIPPPSGDGDVNMQGQNCVTMTDEYGMVNSDCHDVSFTKPNLSINKTGPTHCPMGEECTFTITVAAGANGFNGNVMLIDTLSLDGFTITGMSPQPQGCEDHILSGQGLACVMALNLGQHDQTDITVTAMAPAGAIEATQGENCAAGLYASASVPLGGDQFDPDNMTVANSSIQDVLAQNQVFGNSCASFYIPHPGQTRNPAPETGDNPSDEAASGAEAGTVPSSTPVLPGASSGPQIEIVKTSNGACAVSEAANQYSCDFSITVTNSGNANYSGPVVLSDTFGSPAPSSVDNVGGTGWSCTPTNGQSTNCIHGSLTLAPGQSSTVSMSLTLPGQEQGGSFENCAVQGVGDSAFEQVSIVQYAMTLLGIDPGGVDGVMGPNTQAALRQLQQQLSLPVTGQVSSDLFAALGVPLASDQAPSCVTVDLPPINQSEQSSPAPQDPKPNDPAPATPAPSTGTSKPPVIVAPPMVPSGSATSTSLKCDRATTVKKGRKCACRYSRMVQTSKTRCACVKGTKLVPGQGCVKPSKPRPPKPPLLKCDTATTVLKGGNCRCKIRGMRKVSKTRCACPKGTKYVPGAGCHRDKPTKPKPPLLKCDKATTVLKGGRCLCKIPGMKKITAIKCACGRGTRLIKGKCVKVVKPKPPLLKCDKRTAVLKGGNCLCKIRGMRKVSKTRCACPKGTRLSNKGCIKVFKPKPSQPVPSKPVVTGPRCDPRTTVRKGKTCFCKSRNMKKVSATRCAYVKKPGKPVISKPIKVNPGTAIKRGDIKIQ